MPAFRAALVLSCALAAVSPAAAQFVSPFDGLQTASTFEVGSTTPLPALGWTNLSGSARMFDQSGLNGAMIGTTPYGNYQVQYTTAFARSPLRRYTLTIDMGFYAGNAGGIAGYQFELGTMGSGGFSTLAAQSGQAGYSGNMGIPGWTPTTRSITHETGDTISNDPLAVRWAQISTGFTSDFFGFDNVRLQVVPIPEPAGLLAGAAAAFAVLARRRALRRATD